VDFHLSGSNYCGKDKRSKSPLTAIRIKPVGSSTTTLLLSNGISILASMVAAGNQFGSISESQVETPEKKLSSNYSFC
jgi:hypothetical protein